jgi:hypothetical protein
MIDPEITAEQQSKDIKMTKRTIEKKVDTTDIVQLISAGKDKSNLFKVNYYPCKIWR